MKEYQERRYGGLSIEAKAELWARWRAGESMSDIGRAFGKHPGSIYTLLSVQGGIARAPRRRAEVALMSGEREHISRGVAAEQSIRQIARELRRPASTVSREIARNGGRTHYRAVTADKRAWRRAERPKRCRLALEPELCAVVVAKLELD